MPGPSDLTAAEDPDGTVAPDAVSSRAEGRPPEEDMSDDPEAQARAILEESEERITEGAQRAEPIESSFPKPSEDQLEEDGAD